MAKSGGSFKKGQSGNPSGRPAEIKHVRELARQHTEEAINTLAQICRSGEKEQARVAAAEALLNRAWGRPEQAIHLEDQDGKTIVPQIQIIMRNNDAA